MQFENIEKFIEDYGNAVKEKRPFCSVSIGDGECLFLLDIDYRQPDARNGIYHDRSGAEEDLRQKTMKLLPIADYIMAVKWDEERVNETRNPDNPTWKQHIFSYPEVIKRAKADECKLASLEDKYILPVKGMFEPLTGKRILTIGYAGGKLNRLIGMKEFRDYYNFEAEPAGFIPCSETNSIADVPAVEDAISKLTPFKDYDIALVAMGIPANYICLKIKELGGVALDLGQTISGLTGDRSQRRAFFEDYLKTENL